VGIYDKTAALRGFFVKILAIGDGHIKNPSAFPAMQVMVMIPPPVVTKNIRIDLNRDNLTFFFKNLEVTVNRPETHVFFPGNKLENLPRRQVIPAANSLQNQVPQI
jgi:hypothetical protein